MTELSGIVVPMITPLLEGDRVDRVALSQHIEFLIAGGVDGIFVAGSAGEGPLLTLGEWERLVGYTHEACRGRVPLLAGAMDTSTARVLEKIDILSRIGYERFVITPTFYIPLTSPNEHLRLFGACKERAGAMEMVAYNLPSNVNSNIAIGTMCEMARRGWIRLCKDSSEDMPYLRSLIAEGAKLGLKVLQGSERLAGEGLLAGAVGLVNVGANYDPGTFSRICAAARRNDVAEVARLQQRIMLLKQHLLLSADCWLAGVKYSVARQGIGTGRLASPLEPLTQEQEAFIGRFLDTDRGVTASETASA